MSTERAARLAREAAAAEAAERAAAEAAAAPSADPEPDPAPSDGGSDLAGVARGGTANLLGAVVYGASNFVLLIVLTRGLGVHAAGVVVVAIAIFNILVIVGGLGASTGLVRFIASLRARGETARIPGLLKAALVPVTAVSVVAAVGLWLAAPALADLFAKDNQTGQVVGVLRAMAPFVPFATLQSTVVQATRGFGTMTHQVVIEKLGRSIAMPVAAGIAAATGSGPRGVGVAWAATNAVALVFSIRALQRQVATDLRTAQVEPAALDRETSKTFWSFTGPRALAQTFDTAISWFDTIVVGAILSTTKAGIYASGTRYLLPGLFAADAMVQVTSPRLSALLARHRKAEASELVQVVAGWQVAVMWPTYLVIALFPTPLLRIFGAEVVQARSAMVVLAITMLFVAPVGPTGAVIMMAGRSRQAMVNAFVGLMVNIVGNLLFVDRYGLLGAGLVWAATILVVEGLTVWQTNVVVGVRTFGRPALVAMANTLGTIGLFGLAMRLLVGDDTTGLLLTAGIGGALYAFGLIRLRSDLHLDTWWNGLRGSRRSA